MSDETKIRFLFDHKVVGKRIPWKDAKKIQKFSRMRKTGEEISDEFLEQLQVCVCRLMTNEAGEYLPLDEAYAVFEELGRDEAIDAIAKFTKAYIESTIPNPSGEPSNSTSIVNSPTPTNSPTGSAP